MKDKSRWYVGKFLINALLAEMALARWGVNAAWVRAVRSGKNGRHIGFRGFIDRLARQGAFTRPGRRWISALVLTSGLKWKKSMLLCSIYANYQSSHALNLVKLTFYKGVRQGFNRKDRVLRMFLLMILFSTLADAQHQINGFSTRIYPLGLWRCCGQTFSYACASHHSRSMLTYVASINVIM